MHNKNPQLARCPHCDSVFEVSEAEMQLAFGAVRCGECMKIFNARFHQVEALQDALQPDPEERSSSDPIPTLRDHYHQDFNDRQAHTAELAETEAFFDTQPADPLETNPLDALQPLETQPHESAAQASRDQRSDAEHDGVDDDDLEEEDAGLATEARSRPQSAQSGLLEKFQDYKWSAAAGSLVLALILAATAWFFLNAPTTPNLVAEEVRISPSMHPQKMEVHFQLLNEGDTLLPVKLFQVELLNLSGQVIATEKVNADSVSGNPDQIAPRESLPVQLEVERPATYVQGARIQSIKSGTQ